MAGRSAPTPTEASKKKCRSHEDLENAYVEEKIPEINRMVFCHPRMKHLIRRFDQLRKLSKGAAEPECMMITGLTGVGKTTLVDQYLKRNPRHETEEGAIVPVIAATVPIPATIKTVASSLLTALGDPCPTKGTLDDQTKKLKALLKNCKTELVIIEEFQHFIDLDRDRVLRQVADWLKNLISQTRSCFVITGLPQSIRILAENEQLRRRFSAKLNISYFQTANGRRSELTKLLRFIAGQLPFEGNSYLTDGDLYKRFRYATKGNIGMVLKIVKGAAFTALIEKAPTITISMLEKSFAERIIPSNDCGTPPEEANPFHPKWVPPPPRQEFTKVGTQVTASSKMSRAEANRQMRGVFSTVVP